MDNLPTSPVRLRHTAHKYCNAMGGETDAGDRLHHGPSQMTPSSRSVTGAGPSMTARQPVMISRDVAGGPARPASHGQARSSSWRGGSQLWPVATAWILLRSWVPSRPGWPGAAAAPAAGTVRMQRGGPVSPARALTGSAAAVRRSIPDSAGCNLQPKTRREPRRHSANRGAPVSASQIPVRARATGDRLPLSAARQDRADVHGRAGVRLAWWRRLCPSSFVLAGITVFVLWDAVAGLLRQGGLGTVLSSGRAELAAPLLVALVVATGICERIWPAERRPLLARGHVQDACFLALHAVVVIPLMTLLSVGAAALIGSHARWIELRPAEHWPGWLLMPLTVVAMDGANWLAHYADHRLGPRSHMKRPCQGFALPVPGSCLV